MPDFVFVNHFSLFLVTPQNPAALAHLQAVTDGQWLGPSLAVEPRYVEGLAQGLQDDGFVVQGGGF